MPNPDPVAAVQQYIEAFNKGDVKAMAALCADPMSILDGMAPHVWHGPSATQDWYRDVLTEVSTWEPRSIGSPWATRCMPM